MGVRYGSTWSCLIKDVVTWTTMIHGFSQNGEYEKGLAMFFEMLVEGVKPNDQTIVCVFLACAEAGALETGVFDMAEEKDLLMVDLNGTTGRLNATKKKRKMRWEGIVKKLAFALISGTDSEYVILCGSIILRMGVARAEIIGKMLVSSNALSLCSRI
nr:pentatricopeptide repeat-containing protein At1g04840 [Tanacetum cinerariifolium]